MVALPPPGWARAESPAQGTETPPAAEGGEHGGEWSFLLWDGVTVRLLGAPGFFWLPNGRVPPLLRSGLILDAWAQEEEGVLRGRDQAEREGQGAVMRGGCRPVLELDYENKGKLIILMH